MKTSITTRLSALLFSALLSVVMLGGIDRLASQPHSSEQVLARVTAPTAL